MKGVFGVYLCSAVSNVALLKNNNMKSKCYFDLNANDESVICAQITYTDDIRDKVANRFYENLGHESNLAVVRIFPDLASSEKGIEKFIEIKTVAGDPSSTSMWLKELSLEQLKIIRNELEAVIHDKGGSVFDK